MKLSWTRGRNTAKFDFTQSYYPPAPVSTVNMSFASRLKARLEEARSSLDAPAEPRSADTIRLFTASWCQSCHRVIPAFRKLRSDDPRRLKQVDVSKQHDPRWERFNIRAVPTLAAYRDGKELGRLRGGVTPVKMARFIEDHLEPRNRK